MNSYRQKQILLFCFFSEIFILVCIFFFFQKSETLYQPPLATVPLQSSSIEKNWLVYIRQVGVQKAYTDFKDTYKNFPSYKQHIAIHGMGKLLYTVKGNNGITICDGFGANGCYHGFFGEAVLDQGLTNLKDMDKACIEKWGPYRTECQHGIGHGIMMYVGTDNLLQALDICEKLQYPTKLEGCKLGVFMEYNFNTIRHTDNPIPRSLDPDSPYEPCASLPKQFHYSCYYAQPDWWNTVYKSNYKKIGELCDALEAENKKICFIGAGIIAAESTFFNPDNTIKACEQITSPDGTMLCKAGASSQYQAFGKDKKTVDSICDANTPSLKIACLTNASYF
jgi:hypothetical protein